jgi:hypothetical protein
MSLRWIPWAVITDVSLACVPMIDARIIYGLTASIIVYLVVVVILRSTDKLAVENHWGMWGRIAPKVVIVIVAELAVSVSATETCDLEMTNCHRIFSQPVLIAVVISVLIIAAIANHLISKTGKFWRLAAKKADLALALFSIEPHCLIDQTPLEAQRKEYVGPFKLMDHYGHRHRVYIDHAHIDEIQARMTQELKGVATQGGAKANSCRVHILDAKQAGVHTEIWNIGERVTRKTYETFTDNNGELHVLIAYENGEPRLSVVQKIIWDQAAELFATMEEAPWWSGEAKDK